MAVSVKDRFGLILLATTIVTVIVHAGPWTARHEHKQTSMALEPGAVGSVKLVFLDVNVLPMDREVVLHRHVVFTENGVITEVVPLGELEIPVDALVINGHGTQYLIPGLTDAHVHLDERAAEWFPLLLARGVTTVFAASRAEPAATGGGGLLGQAPPPTIYEVDATTEQHPHGALTRTWWTGACELELGLVPPPVDAPSNLEALAAEWSLSGAWFVPRLVAFEAASLQWGSPDGLANELRRGSPRMVPQAMLESWISDNPFTGRDATLRPLLADIHSFKHKLLRELHRAGTPVLTGTDTPLPLVPPGYSLINEIEELSRSGLSPHESLMAATTNAVRFVRAFIDDTADFGVVRVGARADLVLLEGDPLEDLSYIDRPKGVAIRGEWISQETLIDWTGETEG